jgi:hypothetical protein
MQFGGVLACSCEFRNDTTLARAPGVGEGFFLDTHTISTICFKSSVESSGGRSDVRIPRRPNLRP